MRFMENLISHDLGQPYFSVPIMPCEFGQSEQIQGWASVIFAHEFPYFMFEGRSTSRLVCAHIAVVYKLLSYGEKKSEGS